MRSTNLKNASSVWPLKISTLRKNNIWRRHRHNSLIQFQQETPIIYLNRICYQKKKKVIRKLEAKYTESEKKQDFWDT